MSTLNFKSFVRYVAGDSTPCSPLAKVGFLGGVLGAALISLPALAQVNQATITAILGRDQEVFIQDQTAQENDSANLGEEVRTEAARAQLSFNTGAAGRMTENSSVLVGQCIEVEQGTVIASGPANGCIAGFAVGVQGTIYVMRADAGGIGSIFVLEGQVRLASQDNPNDPNALVINAGQKIPRLTRGLALQNLVIEQLSQGEYEQIITGPLFQGYPQPLAGQEKIQQICDRLYGKSCVAVGSKLPQIEDGTPVRGLW
ncbi:MAG: hypothetical protein HC835_11895 [Oscillatoriales cyanobacterium RM2_1_1]|nr:hypothetical protein [Oscillatoriales cyanobacterium RM2_1_1]